MGSDSSGVRKRQCSDPLEVIGQSQQPRAVQMLLNFDLNATRQCHWKQAVVKGTLQTVGGTKETSHCGVYEGQDGGLQKGDPCPDPRNLGM